MCKAVERLIFIGGYENNSMLFHIVFHSIVENCETDFGDLFAKHEKAALENAMRKTAARSVMFFFSSPTGFFQNVICRTDWNTAEARRCRIY